MGAEQSNQSGESSLSVAQQRSRNEGASPKPWRSEIVTVNSGPTLTGGASIQQDPDIVKLNEIPVFYPLLRSTLQTGLKDAPDIGSRFDYRPISAICQRYEYHLATCSAVVTGEQQTLGTRIREVDYAIASLANYLAERCKRYAKVATDMNKIREVSASLKRIDSTLPEIIQLAKALNEILPSDLQLEPLCLAKSVVCEGISEERAFDVTDDLVLRNANTT